MPQENIQRFYEENEIDLYELWLVLKRRKKIILGTVAAFLLVAIFYLMATPKVYKTTFAIEPTKEKTQKNSTYLISPYEIKTALNNLKYLLKEKRIDELRQRLKIKNPESIKTISINQPRGQNIVEISIESTNKDTLKLVPSKIGNYLQSVPSIKEKYLSKKEILKKQCEALEKQITALKKFKENVIQKDKISKDDISSITQIEILIKELEQDYIIKKENLKNLRPFLVIEPQIYPSKPAQPKTTLVLAIAIVSGLFLGMFLAFFIEWLENARKRHQGE